MKNEGQLGELRPRGFIVGFVMCFCVALFLFSRFRFQIGSDEADVKLQLLQERQNCLDAIQKSQQEQLRNIRSQVDDLKSAHREQNTPHHIKKLK